MVAYRLKTFKDIQDAVIEQAKADSTDTAVRNKIKRLINIRYVNISYKRKWTWRTKSRDIRIHAKYTTDTVVFTNGSREVSGVGTMAFTDAMVGRSIIRTSDNQIYEIISVDETANVAKLSVYYNGTSTGASGASYTIFQYKYGLFPDFDAPVKISHNYYRTEMRIHPPREIADYINRFPTQEGKAYRYTIDGYKSYDGIPLGPMVMGYDYLGIPNSLQLQIFPHIPDEEYFLHIDFAHTVKEMDADDDEPIIPRDNRSILMYAALADFFAKEDDPTTVNYYMSQARDELTKMMGEFDAHNSYPQLMGVGRSRKRWNELGLPVELGDIFDILG
jgi:hypothetical protein